MKTEEIARIIHLMERHGIAEFEYEIGATELKLSRDAATARPTQNDPAMAMASRPEPENPATIDAPGVGWFLISHPAATTAPAPLPRRVEKGEIVGYIRTGALLRPVLADRDCDLLRALRSEGTAVGYGEALFTVTS